MILFNETIGIDLMAESEWLAWTKEQYIPAVMKTAMFTNYKIYKVLSSTEDGTISYSLQFFADSMDQVEQYLDVFAPVLIEKHRVRFKDRHVTFRTLLEEVI